MLRRLSIHLPNAIMAIIWILKNIFFLKKDLKSKGYFNPRVYKFFLWDSNKQYFKIQDKYKKHYFLKICSRKYVKHESKIINVITKLDTEKINFYPKIILSVNGKFNYNIFEFFDGQNILRERFENKDMTKQIFQILLFFRNNEIIHRDIRPHNIIVQNGKIKIIDYEHCSIKNIKIDFYKHDLNKLYSPKGNRWDDAFSFVKVLDKLLTKNEIEQDSFYNKIYELIRYDNEKK